MGVTQKNSTKIGQPYIYHQTKEGFDLWIKANLQVLQNHSKQVKTNIFSHFSPSLGLNKPP